MYMYQGPKELVMGYRFEPAPAREETGTSASLLYRLLVVMRINEPMAFLSGDGMDQLWTNLRQLAALATVPST